MKLCRALPGLILALGTAGCVPATEEVDPRGGVAVITEPTAITRGEPFVTADGWSVKVEQLVLQAYVILWPTNGEHGGYGGMYLFRASEPQEFIVRAVAAGAAQGMFQPITRSVGREVFEAPEDNHGVDPVTRERFNRISDDIPPQLALEAGKTEFEVSETGPALLVVVRGERAGQVVRLDLAIGDTGTSASDLKVNVVANALVKSRVEVAAESLFFEEGRLVFDDIANADTDGDGNVSPLELRRYTIPRCRDCTEEEQLRQEAEASAKALSSILGRRMAGLLVPR